MKKIISLFVAFCLMLVSLPVVFPLHTHGAEDVTVDGIVFQYVENGGYYTVTDYVGEERYVVVPPQVGSVPVKSISDGAFGACYNIKSIVISEGIASIGKNTFWACYSLAFVSIPSTVDEMGENQFEACGSLETVICYLESPGDNWNENWNSNSSADAGFYFLPDPSCYAEIADGQAYDLYLDGTQTHVLVPAKYNEKQVVSVRSASNSNLKGVYILDGGVTSVTTGAFANCTSLSFVRLPKQLSVFQSGAFENCSSLKKITIPEGITEIKATTFKGCTSLEEIKFSSPITLIGIGAFSDCTSLKKINLSDGLTSIGTSAFKNCASLTSMTIPATVVGIGADAFFGCTSLATIYFRGIEIPDEWDPSWLGDCGANVEKDAKNLSFQLSDDETYYIVSGMGNYEGNVVVIPEEYRGLPVKSVEYLGYYSLIYTEPGTGIQLMISKNVTSIADNAFADWMTLETVWVDSGNPIYYSEGNAVVEKETKTLLVGTGTTVIPGDGSVLHIADNAFYNNHIITEISIPSGIQTIGNKAFCGCIRLESVYIPATVTSIGDSAFCNTGFETSFEVAAGNPCYFEKDGCLVETDTKTLIAVNKSCIIPTDGSVTAIGNDVFAYWGETTVIIPDAVTSLGDRVFSQSAVVDVFVPDSVKTIGNYAFYNCYGLKTVRGCVGVESIGDAAFSGCELLENPVFSENLKSIGMDAFANCRSLTRLVLPASVETIGRNTFSQCASLVSVVLPSKMKIIPEYMFSNCSALESVSLPAELEEIQTSAFGSCTSLTGIVFPAGLKTIGSYAFDNCTGLKKVCAPDISFWLSIDMNYSPMQNGADLYFYDSESGSYKIVEHLVIPEISTIKANAFSGCTSIVTVTIPKATTDMGKRAFADCPNITHFYCAAPVQPARWKSNWNSGTDAEVHWGYSAPCFGTHTPGAPADCENPQTCIVCGEILEYASGNHTPSHEIHSCADDDVTCTVCGAVLQYAWPHSPGAPADCKNPQICTVCETVLSPCAPHREGPAATCTEDQVCLDCGTVIKKAGHTAGPAASCEREQTCSKCGEVLAQKLPHTPGTAATCTADQLCKICKTVITPRTGHTPDREADCEHESRCTVCKALVAPKTEHKAGEWVVTTKPTFVNDGEKQKLCIYCNTVLETDIIPMYVLDIKEIEEEIHIAVPPNVDADIDSAVLYDITLTQDSVTVQPDGSVEVRLPVPADMDPNRIRVWHIDEKGNVTDMNATVKDGEVVFVTDHFSYYMIVEADPPAPKFIPGDINGDNNINTTDYLQAKRIVLGTYEGTADRVLRGDLNGNGVIDTSDYAKIKRHVLGTYVIG